MRAEARKEVRIVSRYHLSLEQLTSVLQGSPVPPEQQEEAVPRAELVAAAAAGEGIAAQHCIAFLLADDPLALQAAAQYPGPDLLERCLEWLALGTRAGKRVAFPAGISETAARAKIRQLFLPGPGRPNARGRQVLCAGLHHRRAQIRAKVAQLLGLRGEPATAADLEQALRDPNQQVRRQAAKALGRLHLSQAAPALVNALETHDEGLASQVRLALLELGSEAIPALLAHTHAPDPWVRWHVLRIVGEPHDVRGVPALVEELADRDHAVAWMAARSLPSPGIPAIAAILRLLFSAPATPWLMETAGYVLRRQQHPQLQAVLEPVLHALHGTSYRITVPQEAARALEEIKPFCDEAHARPTPERVPGGAR